MRNKSYSFRLFPVHLAMLFTMLLLPSVSNAALNAYVELTCNGSAIQGESTVEEMGGIDVSQMIEAFGLGLNVSTGVDGSGRVSGSRVYKPIRILKRIDRSTPLIAQALAQNEPCEAVIRFFRNDRDTGATEHFFTIMIEEARIVAIMPALASTLDPSTAQVPLTEAVSIVFAKITYTHEDGGTEFVDDWAQNR